MKYRICFLFFIFPFTCLPSVLDEQDVSISYKINNVSPFQHRKKMTSISADLPGMNWNIGADCSGFDAGISLEGMMNDLDSQFNKLQRDAVNSMKGFITRLPMLLIQRMDPGVYELINNGIIKGEEVFNLSVQSCENMSANFAQNGFGALANESTYYSFSSSLISDPDKKDTDIVELMNEVGSGKGQSGVPRLGGGVCGDSPGNPCKPVEEAAFAGVNVAFKDALLEPSVGGVRDNWIKKVFENPVHAKDWILDTLGRVEYGTCKRCTQYDESVGTGVYVEIAKEASLISTKLSNIVNDGGIPKKALLDDISANDLFIDENVIFALRDEKIHRGAFISRISDDLALMKVIDKLLASRRILIVGKSDPHFQSVSMNREILNEKISLITDEIRMLKEELDLKSSAKGDVIVRLLDRYSNRRNTDVQKNNTTLEQEIVDGIKRVSGRKGS